MSERITEITHLPESEASEALEKEVTTYRILNHLFQVDNEYIRAGDIEGAVSFGKAPKCVVIRHFNCRCAGFGWGGGINGHVYYVAVFRVVRTPSQGR
jgi:hypothetical protein